MSSLGFAIHLGLRVAQLGVVAVAAAADKAAPAVEHAAWWVRHKVEPRSAERSIG